MTSLRQALTRALRTTRRQDSVTATTTKIDGCKTCRFASELVSYSVHQCRRHAPRYEVVPHWTDLRKYVPTWPLVNSGDWCGDHEKRSEG